MAKVKTTTRILVMSDLHAPYQDEAALQVVEQFRKDFKPTIVIALGDWLDVMAVSSFAYDSNDDTCMAREYESCNQLLDRFRPDYYFEGNHEERLRRAAFVKQDYRKIFDPKRWLGINKRGMKWIPYDNTKPLKIGNLNFIHGFEHGMNAARGEAKSFGNVVHGHTHRIVQTTEVTAGEKVTAYNIGCLCDLAFGYGKTKRPRPSEHGFGWGYIYKSGKFTFNIAQLSEGQIHINQKEYSKQ